MRSILVAVLLLAAGAAPGMAQPARPSPINDGVESGTRMVRLNAPPGRFAAYGEARGRRTIRCMIDWPEGEDLRLSFYKDSERRMLSLPAPTPMPATERLLLSATPGSAAPIALTARGVGGRLVVDNLPQPAIDRILEGGRLTIRLAGAGTERSYDLTGMDIMGAVMDGCLTSGV
ncbi:hypothetical protein EOD42_13320 [Rhodovarius crocodyli]|uniref:Invasion associated locus B family protein n=1 Tax=Rhodovarius crocodyli TaxID=1979269 RepID=A0A437MEN5_9PROT|nr:hypothetical protein [Rhodovarius crocodyli]RVT96097.1 hypothetical protein EOD42_13320 [Rhodovarius crocodyli]